MKILILADNLKYGGALTVLENSVKHIVSLNSRNDTFLVVNNQQIKEDILRKINIKSENILISNAETIKTIIQKRYSSKFKTWIKQNEIIVTYNLTNLPLGFTKEILLIHNALLLDINKNNFSIRYVLRKVFLILNLYKVQKIIVQTDFMKNLLMKSKVSEKKIMTIPSGVTILKSDIKSKDNKITKFMMVAKDYPHKNLDIIAHSVKELRDRYKINNFVVYVYMNDKEYKNSILHQKICEFNLHNNIINKGLMEQELILKEYEVNNALILPTRLESFCLPYVEAMSRGCGILTSDLEFSHEICGDAAIYFNQEDCNEIADKMFEYTSNKELQKELMDNALYRFNTNFISWEKNLNLVYEQLKLLV